MTSLKILTLFLFSLTTYAAAPSGEFLVCKNSQDCVVTQEEFCGCGGMGFNTAINKTKLKKWNKKLQKEGDGSGCLAAMSDHWTCIKKVKADCLNNKCVLVEVK